MKSIFLEFHSLDPTRLSTYNIYFTHVLFYTLDVAVFSKSIGKLSRMTEQIFCSSVTNELLLNIVQ